MNEPKRECRFCHRWLPMTEFRKHGDIRGNHHYCKTCIRCGLAPKDKH